MRVASRRRHPHRRGVLHWSDSISNSRRRRTPGQQINLILPALNPMMASSQTDTGDVRRVHLVVVTEAFRWHKVARTGGRSHVTSRPSPFATQVDNSCGRCGSGRRRCCRQRAGSLILILRLFLDKMSEKRVANVGCLILARAKGPGLCTSQPNTDKPAAPLHHA